MDKNFKKKRKKQKKDGKILRFYYVIHKKFRGMYPRKSLARKIIELLTTKINEFFMK